MDRRGFLKNFGIGAAGVAVPSTVLSQTSDELDAIDIWESEVSKQINIFSEKTDIAYNNQDKTQLPIEEHYDIVHRLGEIQKYCIEEEDLPLCDNVIDNLFTSLIKYNVVLEDSTRAHMHSQTWFHLWQKVGDDFMRRTEEECEYIIDARYGIERTYFRAKVGKETLLSRTS